MPWARAKHVAVSERPVRRDAEAFFHHQRVLHQKKRLLGLVHAVHCGHGLHLFQNRVADPHIELTGHLPSPPFLSVPSTKSDSGKNATLKLHFVSWWCIRW